MVNLKNKTPNSILEDNQKLIFFLVLFFKDFTFDKELNLNFNLSKFQIQEASEFLSHFGFLVLRQFSDLDELVQEALFKTIPDPDKFYNQNPKVYVLSEAGREFAYEFVEQIKGKTEKNDFFQDLFEMVKKKTESFLIVKQKLEDEENLILSRNVTFPNGILLEKPTIKAREIKKVISSVLEEESERIIKLKREFLESKKESGYLLNDSEKNALVNIKKGDLTYLQNTSKKEKILKNSIVYNGMFSNLSKTQVLKLAEGLTEKEVKLADKKFGKNGNKWEVDKLVNYWGEDQEKATFACFGADGHGRGGILEDDEFEELLEDFLSDDKNYNKDLVASKKENQDVEITQDNIFDVLGIDKEE